MYLRHGKTVSYGKVVFNVIYFKEKPVFDVKNSHVTNFKLRISRSKTTLNKIFTKDVNHNNI